MVGRYLYTRFPTLAGHDVSRYRLAEGARDFLKSEPVSDTGLIT